MKNLNYTLHECLRNHSVEKLHSLMQSQELGVADVDEDIYVELIFFRWDDSTIMRFTKVASDDQLAVLISTAILNRRSIPFKDIFAHMKNPSETIKKHHLESLFLIACDNSKRSTIEAMIAFGCFNTSDSRPIVVIFRRFLESEEVDDVLISLVLRSHPSHIDSAEYLRDECIPHCKFPKNKDLLLNQLVNYINLSKQNTHND